MKKEVLKSRIVKRIAGMPVPKLRIVHAYAIHMIRAARRRQGVDDIPEGRPAPGQIVQVICELLDKAENRELFCILKFARDVQRHF